MKKGLRWAFVFALIVLVAFCAAFMISIKLYIEPAYDYLSKEKIEQQISDLKQQIADKDRQIASLTEELDRYVNVFGDIDAEIPDITKSDENTDDDTKSDSDKVKQ